LQRYLWLPGIYNLEEIYCSRDGSGGAAGIVKKSNMRISVCIEKGIPWGVFFLSLSRTSTSQIAGIKGVCHYTPFSMFLVTDKTILDLVPENFSPLDVWMVLG
jgi:hypothetical protein